MLSWEKHIQEGNVRKTITNTGKIKALVKMSKRRLDFVSKQKPTEEYASIIFTNYYDSLREICEALSLLEGYKIYSHEALGLFLKQILNEDSVFIKFDRFRLMRNGVNYYGKDIPFKEALLGIEDIKLLIPKLLNKYLSNFEV